MNNILVYTECEKGTLKNTSAEALSLAVELAKKAGSQAITCSINCDCAAEASKYGANKAVNIKADALNNYSSPNATKAIAQLADKENAEVVLFPANARGLELAPRVATRMESGYLADVIEVNFDNGITVKKPIYAGKSIAKMKITTPKQVLSLRPNVFPVVEATSTATAEEFAPELTDAKVMVKSVNKTEGKLDVAEADIIVSGGRGMKDPANFNLIEDFAAKLGAAVGASRAAVDANWRPLAEQVGQTGKTVAPSMYVACGISGAIQHLAGMSSSKSIAAINKDKDAPIFNVVDFGIVGDALTVIPKVIAKL
ncbi:MAG: electron transfer flavoprotein subunit alpha [Bacteroidetes bacterium 4572_77]|nr:MAG: electron transfer flavoprotein subunit alpha [Bacteroidetes bacterium 4572_77]